MGCGNLFKKKKEGVDVTKIEREKEKLRDKEFLLKVNNKWKEGSYKPYYKTILLFITNRCNLNCEHCFDRANLRGLKEMSFEYIKKIVDNNPHVEKYDIMGGEPLLHSELNKILNYLEERGKKIGLYTNGFLLNKLPRNYKNLRLNLSFHSIYTEDLSLKPISKLHDYIEYFQYIYPMKLVFLITQENKGILFNFAEYIEQFKNISKLTIGMIRNEEDYYNDNYENIVPFEEYPRIIQYFIDEYSGNLDIDIFAEGIIVTDNLPRSSSNQINRFRCIFPENEYTECLYDVGPDKKKKFNLEKPITYPKCNLCPKTKKDRCLTDKIRLRKR
ncbi:MAG: radical SAM protein [Patescibacteria group bacterium]